MITIQMFKQINKQKRLKKRIKLLILAAYCFESANMAINVGVFTDSTSSTFQMSRLRWPETNWNLISVYVEFLLIKKETYPYIRLMTSVIRYFFFCGPSQVLFLILLLFQVKSWNFDKESHKEQREMMEKISPLINEVIET